MPFVCPQFPAKLTSNVLFSPIFHHSAPEILLSVIEIFGSKFVAGDLGPGTIVGSAAFNLFVIIGICILVIPDGEVYNCI